MSLAVIAVHVAVAGVDTEPAIVVGALGVEAGLLSLFLERGRIVRTLLAAILGLTAAGWGLAVHAPRLVLGGAEGADLTGVLAGAAGLALLVLAFRVALRGQRLRAKLLAIPICLVAVQWIVIPLISAGLVVNSPRGDVPAARTLDLPGARDVIFPARDGVRLSGWYVPGREGAAVILAHGAHGNRSDTIDHLRLLAAAGYAVLAFDARGHGDSAGRANALGWQGVEEVGGALDFLGQQRGVDERRVAMLGLSMGGEEALRASAEGIALKAVVADGAGASTLGDRRVTATGAIADSVNWMGMRATELASGDDEPAPLVDVVDRITVPVLLIASDAPDELAIDRVFRSRIGPSAELWHVADAGHTEALKERPAAYARGVEAFLDGAL